MLQEGSFPSFNVLDDDTAAAAVATERDGHLHPAHAAIVRKEHRREKRPDGTVIETVVNEAVLPDQRQPEACMTSCAALHALMAGDGSDAVEARTTEGA